MGIPDGTLGALTRWVGHYILDRTRDTVQFTVEVSGETPTVTPVSLDTEEQLAALGAAWHNGDIDAVGTASTILFERGNPVGRHVAQFLQGRLVKVDEYHAGAHLTVLLSRDGRDGVAWSSLDKQVTHQREMPPAEAVGSVEDMAVALADPATTTLRATFGMPTRPLHTDPLWHLLCLWCDDAYGNWNGLIAKNKPKRAALLLLDRRPDVVWEMQQLALHGETDLPWPSVSLADADDTDIAAVLQSRDADVALTARDFEWEAAQQIWESYTGQRSPYDAPALFRFGAIPTVELDADPVGPFTRLVRFPEWLGDSTARVAAEWDPASPLS